MNWICPYCQQKATLACVHQKQYETVAKNLDVTTFEIYCSPSLTISERTLFEAFLPNKSVVLEIGCGTFHRTGPYYNKNGISFYGVEPLKNIVQRSDFHQHIFVETFNLDFLQRYPKIQHKEFTAVILLGGMINGIHCPTLQDSFWKALRLLSRNCEVIIMDTLVRSKDNFSYHKSKQGFAYSHQGALPIQYYFSRNELQNLFDTYGFSVAVEGIDILGVGSKTFVLYGDNWSRNAFFKEK